MRDARFTGGRDPPSPSLHNMGITEQANIVDAFCSRMSHTIRRTELRGFRRRLGVSYIVRWLHKDTYRSTLCKEGVFDTRLALCTLESLP